MAWYVKHCGRIRAILSGLPLGEFRPQEKGGSTVANPTTGVEMAANRDRTSHRFARVLDKGRVTLVRVFAEAVLDLNGRKTS